MHMADALISPSVGGIMWIATASVASYSVKKVQKELDEQKAPLMGVIGAFIFAAQMINIAIPGTGSSGHLGGGMLLAILLGPYAGFLTMASVLVIQGLFFADGGLLALGCNIFNLGFYTCFIAYPLIYKQIARKRHTPGRIFIASMISSIIALQLGAFSVVMETFFSGKAELPFGTFVLLMQPIHLAIGVIEGLITTAVVSFVWRTRPEIIDEVNAGENYGAISFKKVFIGFAIITIITGGVLSWFSSSKPDGLEWSIFKVSGQEELESTYDTHENVAAIQDKIAFLPNYSFKSGSQLNDDNTSAIVDAGASISGLVGGGMTLILAGVTGFCIHLVNKKRRKSDAV